MMKTLLILPNAIGDVICGCGVARAFSEKGRLEWVVNPSSAGLLRRLGYTVIVPPSSRVRRMADFGAPVETMRIVADEFLSAIERGGPWDNVINLHMTRASSLIAGAAPANRYFGPALGEKVISDTWSDFFLSSLLHGLNPGIDVVERYSVIAGLMRRAEPDFSRFCSPPTDVIAFQPGSGWESKRLCIEQAASIGDALSELGRVIIIGSPQEREYVDGIRRLMKSATENFVPGNLEDSFDVIASAKLLVTTDTWALHAASALKAPTVALLGPTRVFPSACGYALAPRSEPSYLDRGDESIATILPEDVRRLSEALLSHAPVNAESYRDDVVVWDCRGARPIPMSPLRFDGKQSTKRIFAHARGAAFTSLVKQLRSDLPQPSILSVEESAAMYGDIPRGGIDFNELLTLDNFQLFETTFPGEDASAIQQRWMMLTRQMMLH